MRIVFECARACVCVLQWHTHSLIHIFTQVQHACQSHINIIFQSYVHWYVHISFMDTNCMYDRSGGWASEQAFLLVRHHLRFLIRLCTLCVCAVHALLCCFIEKVAITCFFDRHIMIFVSTDTEWVRERGDAFSVQFDLISFDLNYIIRRVNGNVH